MSWVLIAFVAPLLHGVANILDNYLTNKLFENVWVLAFYSNLFGILFLPLVLLIEIPDFPSITVLPALLLVAAIDIAYLFPYYRALQSEDTSIVSSLFALGKIFVPLFAFLLVGEVLGLTQYLGFLIIILSSAALTIKNRKVLRFNKAFFFMVLCSSLLALSAVMYKYIFENVSWSTGFVWSGILSFGMILLFLLIPKIARAIKKQSAELKRQLPVFASEELLTFGGSIGGTYAISLVPVTLVNAIGAFQPFFVLVYAIVFQKFFPHIFRERINRQSVVKKTILFAAMVFGIYLAL